MKMRTKGAAAFSSGSIDLYITMSILGLSYTHWYLSWGDTTHTHTHTAWSSSWGGSCFMADKAGLVACELSYVACEHCDESVKAVITEWTQTETSHFLVGYRFSLTCLKTFHSFWGIFEKFVATLFFAQRQRLVTGAASCHRAAAFSSETCGSAGVQQFHRSSCPSGDLSERSVIWFEAFWHTNEEASESACSAAGRLL